MPNEWLHETHSTIFVNRDSDRILGEVDHLDMAKYHATVQRVPSENPILTLGTYLSLDSAKKAIEDYWRTRNA